MTSNALLKECHFARLERARVRSEATRKHFSFAGLPQPLVIQERPGATIGSHCWPAAVSLAALVSGGSLVSGKLCVELGAGTGLVGLAAGLAGARRVVLTDLEENLDTLRENISLCGATANVEARELSWGCAAHAESVTSSLPGHVDVVLAAEVCYDKRHFGALQSTILKVCSPDTLLLLGYLTRSEDEEAFFDWLRGHFSVSTLASDVAPDGRAVTVFGCRRLGR